MVKSDDVVTKKYLTLSRVKSENKLINEMRETEKRLENRIEGVEKRLDGRIDSLASELRNEIGDFKKEMLEKYDNLMIMLDKILGMLKKNDEERTAISYRVIDHEDRIQSLEKVQVVL